jgi:hypothetical protein
MVRRKRWIGVPANIMNVYFKNKKNPSCIEIFIRNLKYINIFLILYTKCARKVYVLHCAANQKKFENQGSRQSAHRWQWGSQPHAPAALYPQEDSWYSFLLEAERLEGLDQFS